MSATAAIVNEKLNDDDPETKGYAYAAMIKREAGYDPAHGDWEYVYGEYGDGGRVQRGRLQSCIACHSKAAAQDYLFRTYLKVETTVGTVGAVEEMRPPENEHRR